MSDRPVIEDTTGREKTRGFILAAKGYGISEKKIHELVSAAARPSVVSELQVRKWIEWNQAKGYVTYLFDEDLDMDLWFGTERGRAHERERSL